MGTCRIEIEAVGRHGNGTDTDVDALARAFVTTLKAEGHAVTSARFRVVSQDDDMIGISAASPLEPTATDPLAQIDPAAKYRVEFNDPYYRVSGEVSMGQRDLSEVQNTLHERIAGFAGAKGMTAVDLRLLTVEDVVRGALLIHMEFKLQ